MTRVRTGAPGVPNPTDGKFSAIEEAPARSGPDSFVQPRQQGPVALEPKPRGPVEMPQRGRILDPHLIPLVPPTVTTDPARQYHALLGLAPPAAKAEKAAAKPNLDALLDSLPKSRAKLLRDVLAGPADGNRRKALQAFLDDPKFTGLDFEKQRRALASFALPKK